MSLSPEKSYIDYIKDYNLFHHKRHPREMSVEDMRAELTPLKVDKRITASTQHVALSAWLFGYRSVLKIAQPDIENIERARYARRVPVLFTRDEVKPTQGQAGDTHVLSRGGLAMRSLLD